MRLAILEDGRAMRSFWARLLEGSGHTFVCAESTPAGLKQLRESDADLAICPGSARHASASTVIASLGELVTQRPLVIATSRDDGVLLGGWNLELVDAILPKPFEREELLRLLDRVIAEHRARVRIRPVAVVIEDSRTAARILSQMLQTLGFDVEQASDGQTGLTFVEQHLPNLVLCDVELPGLSGWEVCATLAANPITRDVPVVVTSGAVDDELERRGLSQGVVDFLPKPVDERLLTTIVKRRVRVGTWTPLAGALVLEDEKVVVAIARRMLAELSIAAHVCSTVAEFQGHLRVGTPALLLLDMELPDGSGLEVCRQLRAEPTYDGVPIVMMSASGELARRRACLSAGADDFLLKPFGREEVRVRLAPLVAEATRREVARAETAHRHST
jgi:CheY-like chemotaxis protein